MHAGPTTRLYLQQERCSEAQATIVAMRDNALAFDATCFYPGGGGQPHDEGAITLSSGELYEVESVRADADEIIWHICKTLPTSSLVGERAALALDINRRLTHARYHTVLHVLNTLALRDYQGWITGVQIGTEYSRIDFKLDRFSAALCVELAQKVNAVLAQDHPLKLYYMSEDEFRLRDDMLRTLEVKPPIYGGRVRIVEIEGFDAQACGGTHVLATSEIGRFSIFRTENKGKINKRMYVRLA
jgi:misacylated tRNA(Ala) deacylase